MSMGTRCHQLAAYIVHDSPLTMLCDAPTNYLNEQECGLHHFNSCGDGFYLYRRR